MPDEVNPMADLGLLHDKQVVLEPQGFLTARDAARDLCERFIPKGGKFYDLIDRYGLVTSYVLNREDQSRVTDTVQMVAPFLKAFGVADYDAMEFYRQNLTVAKGSKEAVRYMMDIMPVFVDSCMYEHAVDILCEKLGIPKNVARSTSLDLSDRTCNLSRQECWDLRSIAKDIVELPMPRDKYELNVPLELSSAETRMVATLDDVFLNKLNGTAAAEIISNTASIGTNEKTYALLKVRKTTDVDIDGTVYIGGNLVDYQVMDLVKDGEGLSMAFNGSEFAVHGANVAVVSGDCTVAAVLTAEFYNSGIQGVFDLIDNWNREYLKTANCPDRNLMDRMLALNPRKLPEVYRVTRSNVGEISARSDAFRRKRASEKIRADRIRGECRTGDERVVLDTSTISGAIKGTLHQLRKKPLRRPIGMNTSTPNQWIGN